MIEVMIVRPEKEIGMGCCGGICSDQDGLVNMDNEFSHHDDDRSYLGELYLQTKEKYGSRVHVTFVDPRNLLAIFTYFLLEVKKRHIPFSAACLRFLKDIKYNAIFINGTLVDEPDTYHHYIQERL
ncbi:hypothetical protein MUN89_06625 [Halobacillus salinarum]|uniref:Uncharacterized protein n=1 Tax=Halobacillus salinarum TaxID=2932257 RepID=A0ABY4EMD3_9BACI|nr:hypothetical protein [Halobacillus salinarum]UOQ45610.1 hypothetical protein MUN89_06625 [Halobacillus salinarum]